MNKIDFAKINKKEDMIMAFNQLKDDYSILFQQIQELTNNWNELKEWLKEETKLVDELPDTLEHSDYTDVLDKMEEIEEGRGENG